MDISKFFDLLVASFDWWIVLLVLCSGFFQKKYFQGFKFVHNNDSYDSALKTLALSFIVCAFYIMLLKDPGEARNWSKFFVSYFFATSLYELLVDPFIRWVKKLTGAQDGK